jgi:hypothetical protein
VVSTPTVSLLAPLAAKVVLLAAVAKLPSFERLSA